MRNTSDDTIEPGEIAHFKVEGVLCSTTLGAAVGFHDVDFVFAEHRGDLCQDARFIDGVDSETHRQIDVRVLGPANGYPALRVELHRARTATSVDGDSSAPRDPPCDGFTGDGVTAFRETHEDIINAVNADAGIVSSISHPLHRSFNEARLDFFWSGSLLGWR